MQKGIESEPIQEPTQIEEKTEIFNSAKDFLTAFEHSEDYEVAYERRLPNLEIYQQYEGHIPDDQTARIKEWFRVSNEYNDALVSFFQQHP